MNNEKQSNNNTRGSTSAGKAKGKDVNVSGD
jgi:hypothetical protein